MSKLSANGSFHAFYMSAEAAFLAEVGKLLQSSTVDAEVKGGKSVHFLEIKGEDRSDISFNGSVTVILMGIFDIRLDMDVQHAAWGRVHQIKDMKVGELTPAEAARLVRGWMGL